MANHRAAALLIIASLLIVAVAVADARLTKPRNARFTLRYDAHGRGVGGTGSSMSRSSTPKVIFTIDRLRPLLHQASIKGIRMPAYLVSDAAKAVPSLSCSEVHEVKVDETCFSVAQAAGLTQDQLLSFNPNINCEKVFVGQWVCLAATSA